MNKRGSIKYKSYFPHQRLLAKLSQFIRKLNLNLSSRILISTGNGSIGIWTPFKGLHCRINTKIKGQINCLCPINSNKFASATAKNFQINIWELPNSECYMSLKGHTGSINSLAKIDEDILCSCSDDCNIKIWDLHTGDMLNSLYGHVRPIRSMIYIEKHNLIVSGGEDWSLRVWEYKGPTEITPRHNINAHLSPILKIWEVGNNGEVLSMPSPHDPCATKKCIWNVVKGQLKRELTGAQMVSATALYEHWLAFATKTGKVAVHSLRYPLQTHKLLIPNLSVLDMFNYVKGFLVIFGSREVLIGDIFGGKVITYRLFGVGTISIGAAVRLPRPN